MVVPRIQSNHQTGGGVVNQHSEMVVLSVADVEIVVEPGNLVPSKFLALQQVFGFVTVLCHEFEFPAANSTDFQN